MIEILPSILAADFARLGEQVAQLEAVGCRMLHVDVMDGHFVPNLTIGPPVVQALRKVTKLTLDAVGLTTADITRVVHQATGSDMFLQMLFSPLGIEVDRGVNAYSRKNGRTGPADQVAGLTHLVETRQLVPGDHVLMLGGGPGMTATCAVVEILEAPAWSSEED